MPLSLADRVGETTTTTGTGTINLAGAKTGYQGFVAAGLDGLVVPYVIAHQSADEWEVGYGTVTDATPDTLSRTVVYSSSNAGSLVTFSAGTKDVYLTQPANLLRQTGAPFWVSISPTTSNYSAAVNKKYKADISGLTANRNFIIPSGAEGDWIELFIGTGDDTYAFVVIGDTGVSINGGSTATEWSRLFIPNEYIRLECTAANTWVVKPDLRIPQKAKMYLSSFANGESASTYTRPTAAPTAGAWTSTIDNAGGLVSISNDRVYCRRAGTYKINAGGGPYGGGTAGNYWNFDIRLNDGTSYLSPTVSLNSYGVNRTSGSTVLDMATGDYVNYYYRNNNGSPIGCSNSLAVTFLALKELL